MVAKNTQWGSRKWIHRNCCNLLQENRGRLSLCVDTIFGNKKKVCLFSSAKFQAIISPSTFDSNYTNRKSLIYRYRNVSPGLVLEIRHVSLLLKSSRSVMAPLSLPLPTRPSRGEVPCGENFFEKKKLISINSQLSKMFKNLVFKNLNFLSLLTFFPQVRAHVG